jgi:hypothetical protein
MTDNNIPDRPPALTPQQIRVIAVGHASEIIAGAARMNKVTTSQVTGFAAEIAAYIADGTISQ